MSITPVRGFFISVTASKELESSPGAVSGALLAAGGPVIIQQIRSAADAAAVANRPRYARTRKRNFLPQCFPAGGDGLSPRTPRRCDPARPRSIRSGSSSRAYVPVPDALFHALTP